MNWFETLFGFREGPYHWTQQQLDLDGHTLVSRANGRRFDVGYFSTPSVAALRDRVAGLCPGTLRLRHEAVSDIFAAHAAPENAGAVFQAASQLNCLEFAAPSVVPERGVTIYAGDPTQGPACALAAAAATVFRNYFAEVDGIAGQTTDRQLNNLAGVQQLIGAAGDLVEVRNGYTFSDDARLERLNAVLDKADRAQLVGAVRVGVHAGVGVTFSERYVPMKRPQTVSQVYASALSCGYSAGSLDQWAPLATVALDGAYEATLLAAAELCAAGAGSGVVWLTLLGGGVFGNRDAWIADAIGRAVAQARHHALDVRVAHYRRVDARMAARIDEAVERHQRP